MSVPTTSRQAREMEQHEHIRMRAAAYRATKLYPGPVGELINRELLAWDDFGWMPDRSGLALRLVDELTRPRARGSA